MCDERNLHSSLMVKMKTQPRLMRIIGINDFTTLVVNILLQENIGDAVVIIMGPVGGVLIGAGHTIVLASAVNIGIAVGLVKRNTGVLEGGELLANSLHIVHNADMNHTSQ